MSATLKNKIHYYKSNLNRGYTDINVYNNKENDVISSAKYANDKSADKGVFVQATRWQKKLNARVVRESSDGYGLPSDIKLPSISVGVADNASLNTDLLKVKFAPSFISTNGTNFKTVCAGSYKLLEAVQETCPFIDADSGDYTVAVGTDTCKTYILLMLDNSYGIYNNAENFSNLVRPFLVGGQMNWVAEDKSVVGYRGTPNTAFPTHKGMSVENPTGEAVTYDSIVKKLQFKFNLALDPVCPSLIHKEGTHNGKFYKMSFITFGAFSAQSVTNFHEDKMTNGLNIRGTIGVFQVADTEADKANFTEIEILDSKPEFETGDENKVISQSILESLAGQGLISTENLRQLELTDKEDGDSPIYKLGIHKSLAYLYDMKLGYHDEGDVPSGASIITKFEELKEWEGVTTNITLDQTLSLSGADTSFEIKAPVVCYPKLEISQAVIDAVGAVPPPAKPNRLHFVEAKECLAFKNDLQFLWDTAQTAGESWSDDEKAEIASLIAEAEDYNTGLYSYNTIIEAIKAVFLKRTETQPTPTELSSEREAVYESLFKREWNGSETENNEKDAYEVECWQSYFCNEPIALNGLTENSVIDSPSYLLWGALNEIQVPVTKHLHHEAEINGYYKPKEYVANVGNIIIGKKALTEAEVKADLEYARVWKDIEGKDSMKSGLVEDLYSLKELYDQMNKQGVPVLDATCSEFFKKLCYGRVKDKMPIGSWWFMNCHKDAWSVEDSIINQVWWEKGENFDEYLYAEESQNPDLNCTTVSFRVKEGVIPTDYYKDKNYKRIYASIYYCARAANGKETRQEFRFEIVEPIVLGMLMRTRQYTGITNNVWSAGTYDGVGQFWTKKWINRPLSELDKLGIQPKDNLFHNINVAMGRTPRYITYKHDTSKRYEVPMLVVPAYVMNEDAKLDVDKRKYSSFEVKATDGSSHIIPVSPMVTDTKATKLTAGANGEPDTNLGGGGDGFFGDNYSLIYGYKGGGLDKAETVEAHLVDFGKGVYIRDRVLCTEYASSSHSSASSSSSLCPVYIESSPNQLALQPESFQYRGGSWGVGGRTSSLKAESSAEWFNEFCDTRYGANGYPKANKWLRTEQIFIPASDTGDNSGYLVFRWMWEGENFKEADLYDNSKWKEMYSPVKDGYLIFARGSRPMHFVADYNCWITDLSAIKIYQIDGLIKNNKLPKATATDKASERIAKTKQYADAIYSALQDLDSSISKGLIEPKYDITRDECRYGEFMQFGEDNKAIGHNTMQPHDAMMGWYSWAYKNDYNWLRYGDDNNYSSHAQINMNYSGQVQGYQPLDFEAMILDRDTKDWYLPKSMFSKWLDEEAGLPFCSDYHRQVMMRKVKDDDPTETAKCWALYDSLNYELKVSGDYNNPPKLVRHDGREWNTRQDFMYDNFTFYPRHHYMRIEFETRDVSKNLQHRYRFLACSMGEFEIDPDEILKQLRGSDTTEQIMCVKAWTFDTTNFWNPKGMSNLLEADKGETQRILGSARIANANLTQDFIQTDATDTNLGYYVISMNWQKGIRVFSVPHRAFLGVYAPDGGFDFDYKTQKFTPKIFQDSDGVLKTECYTGYWFSANPVSMRRRTEATEYDTKDNYDNTFCDWFFQAGRYYHGATTPTHQTKRTISIDGVSSSQDLMDRNDLEWCVTGGAPSQYQTGRIIGSVNYGNDLSWEGKLGYIPARFIGKNKELIKTQLGMMSIENRQLTSARWQLWELEYLDKASSYSASAMLGVDTENYTPTGVNGNWLPAVTKSDGSKLTHNNILSSFCASSSSYAGSSSSSSLNGVGSIEYVITRTIQSGRKLGTTKSPVRPLIDYRYFNHTKDSGSIVSGLTAPNNANNKRYGNQVYGDGYIAYMSQWRGGSYNVGDSSITRITGTEKSVYNLINKLEGQNSSAMMCYAPYGYDLPLGLSPNKNAGDTTQGYGYVAGVNPRISVLLCSWVVGGRWSWVTAEGVGNPAFASNLNSVNYGSWSLLKFVRETNRNSHIYIVRDWAQPKTHALTMGGQDGVFWVIRYDDVGTRDGYCLNERYHSKNQIFLNFPSVCSPFNFSLKHGAPDDIGHQPTMLKKKRT